jgi:hypothetical protein
MAAVSPDEGFKVTDRRHRGDEEAASAAETRREPLAPPGAAAAPASRSLVGLFLTLGNSAVIALGEADPTTGEHGQQDLPVAAEIIDLLALLREKTEGRRSVEETEVLEDLLYDLQMRYVTLTKRPG